MSRRSRGALVSALAAVCLLTPAAASADVDLRVLAANDFHGNLEPPTGSGGRLPDSQGTVTDVGGAAFLATHLRQLRGGHANTVTVHAGDAIGGTPLISGLFHDEPAIESLDAMGMNIAGVGNHEFDEGTKELLRMDRGGCHPVDGCFDDDGFSGAKFPFLAANVLNRRTGLPILPPVSIKRYGGIPVGFIGVTLEGTPEIVAASGIKDVRFGNEVREINKWSKVLRLAGVKAIVVLVHQGGTTTGRPDDCAPGSRDASGLTGPIVDIAKRTSSDVDLVVSGHTHWAYICDVPDPQGRSRLVTSSSSFGRAVTVIDLKLSSRTRDVVRGETTVDNHLVTRTVEPDAQQVGLIAKWKAKVAPIANRVVGSITADIGRTAAPSGETPLGNLIADAQQDQTAAVGAQAAFMNPGGVRADLVYTASAGGEAPGDVTYGELFSVQPFNNNLVTMTLTGTEVDTLLEQQWTVQSGGTVRFLPLGVSGSVRYSYSASAPIGSRVSGLAIGGTPVAAGGTYRLTVNSFLADGGDGFTVLRSGTNRVTGAIDSDAFEDYFAAHSPVAPPATNRVTVLP